MSVFKEKKPRTLHAIINEIVDRVNDDTRRLRVLEQEHDITTTRMNTIEKNVLDVSKELQKEIASVRQEIKKHKEQTARLENTVKEIIKEIKQLATNAKISELEELIELYNPIKSSFVTREEVERMIDKKLINRKKTSM